MSCCLQLSDLYLLPESHICQSGVEKCNTATYCAQRELQTSFNLFLILCLCVRIALRKCKKFDKSQYLVLAIFLAECPIPSGLIAADSDHLWCRVWTLAPNQ